MTKRLSAVKKMINSGPLCKVQYSDRVSEIAQARGPQSLALRPQGLLAGTMRYFRAKVNYKNRSALSLLKQTFVRKYHIVPASRPWVHSPRMKGPTLHQQPNLIIYIHALVLNSCICTCFNFTAVLFLFLSSPWGSVYLYLHSILSTAHRSTVPRVTGPKVHTSCYINDGHSSRIPSKRLKKTQEHR